MKIDVLTHTENPERTVCACARGDQSSESLVGVDLSNEDDYGDVMDGVDCYGDDVEYVAENIDDDATQRLVEAQINQDDVEKSVINAAKTRALIRRLIRTYGHFGPFEHPTITFAAEDVSIVVERQITRHRHVTWDVQSLRVVDPLQSETSHDRSESTANSEDPTDSYVVTPDSIDEAGNQEKIAYQH